jgi:hypothetical protein
MCIDQQSACRSVSSRLLSAPPVVGLDPEQSFAALQTPVSSEEARTISEAEK